MTTGGAIGVDSWGEKGGRPKEQAQLGRRCLIYSLSARELISPHKAISLLVCVVRKEITPFAKHVVTALNL